MTHPIYNRYFSKDRLSDGKIRCYLTEKTTDVKVFPTIDSTNTEAKRITSFGLNTPLLICAEEQTAGRGRLGRSFFSPSSTGLYMSLAMKIDASMSDAVLVTGAAAVAVCQAIESISYVKCDIKWVNDILIDGKKVCGILTEAFSSNNENILIIGIGVNCTTSSFPEEITATAGSVGKLDRNMLAALIVNHLLRFTDDLSSRSWLDEYRSRSIVLGKDITYYKNGSEHFARVKDINHNGALIVEENGETLTLSTGEISLRI